MRNKLGISFYNLVISAFFLFLILHTLVQASVLEDLASSMAPGTWEELNTTNTSVFQNGDHTGMIIPYSESISWYENKQYLLFLGGDHNGEPQFVKYETAANSWSTLTQPSWARPTMHGYDHMAINNELGLFYYRKVGNQTLHAYDIKENTWADLPTIPNSIMGYANYAVAIEYFPEINALLYVSREDGSNQGSLIKYDENSGFWSRISDRSVLNMGEYHHFAEYNPVHKVVVFGGGNNGRGLHMVNDKEDVITLNDAPINIGITASIFTVDPVSGDYIIFSSNKEKYIYDVTTDNWQSVESSNVPIWTSGFSEGPLQGVVATPIKRYGVILFVRCSLGEDPKIFLYKHEQSNQNYPSKPTNIKIAK